MNVLTKSIIVIILSVSIVYGVNYFGIDMLSVLFGGAVGSAVAYVVNACWPDTEPDTE